MSVLESVYAKHSARSYPYVAASCFAATALFAAEHFRHGRDHLLAGRREHDHVMAVRAVPRDQFGGFDVHERVDHVVEGFAHDGRNLRDVPAGAQLGDLGPQPFRFVRVGAGEGKNELGVSTAQRRATIDQPLFE